MDRKIMCDNSMSVESRLIYAVLACYADKSRECFPSVDTLIHDTGLCKTTFYKHMKTLIERNIVIKTPRLKGNLYNGVTYQINDFSG